MLRIMLEQTLNRDEEIRVCFIDWQKASDHVKWTKLMQILNKTGTDCHKRSLIYRELQFHPDSARKLSANLYDIYHCCV